MHVTQFPHFLKRGNESWTSPIGLTPRPTARAAGECLSFSPQSTDSCYLLSYEPGIQCGQGRQSPCHSVLTCELYQVWPGIPLGGSDIGAGMDLLRRSHYMSRKERAFQKTIARDLKQEQTQSG